jgi:hypothetical protein
MLVFGLFCCGAIFAQENALTVSSGSSVGIPNIGTAPIKVFQASLQSADGSPGPDGRAIIAYTPPFSVSGRSEISVAAKPLNQGGRVYAENSGPASVGVAFANPNNRDVTLSFYFTDGNGVDFGGGSTVVPANTQIARFLAESPFNAPSGFQGTFTYTASGSIATLAARGYVNETGLFLMPQIPIAEFGLRTSSVVPYFENGTQADRNSGTASVITTTDLVLVNPTDNPLSGTFTFSGAGDSGTPVQPVVLTIDGQTRSTFSYAIPAHSSRRFTTDGTGPSQHGSIFLDPTSGSQPPLAFGILSVRGQGFLNREPIPLVVRSQTTIPAQAPAAAFRVPVSGLRLGGIFAVCCVTRTVVSITNPSGSLASVSLDLTSMNLSATLTVPARGQIVFSPEAQWHLPFGYSGLLRVSSSSQISAVALQRYINFDVEVFAVEAFDESATTGAQRIFPHLPSGSGYGTRIQVWKTSDSQAPTGMLRLFTQSGDLVDPSTVTVVAP